MNIWELFENTENTLAEIAKLLVKNCSPFLQQITEDTPPLWRGQNNFIIPVPGVTNVGQSSTLEKREPAGSKLENHKIADKWFKEKFGIKFRSNYIVFSTSDRLSSKIYGNPYIFIPKGNFQFCWSPILDDFINIAPIQDEIASLIAKKLNVERYNLLPKEFDKYRKKANAKLLTSRLEMSKYQTTNLQAAINSENEIMFHCKEYYLLNVTENEYKEIIQLTRGML